MKIVLIAVLLLLGFASTLQASAQTTDDWTMVFRITADPEHDRPIVSLAMASNLDVVLIEAKPVAEWIPVVSKKVSSLRDNPSLVTRPSREGQGCDLLVLVGRNDVTEAHLSYVREGLDRDGNLVPQLSFNEEGSADLREMTSNNIGRHLAQIVNGQVYAASRLIAQLSLHAMIPGDFTEEEASALIHGLSQKATPEYVFSPYYSIVRPLFTLLVVALTLAIAILAMLPARDLKPVTLCRVWPIICAIAGACIGGYLIGVSITYGRTLISDGPSTVIALAKTYNVELLWVLIGAIVGSVLGFFIVHIGYRIVRRAIHNVKRLVRRNAPQTTG